MGQAAQTFSTELDGELKQAWFDLFTKNGSTPVPGELFASPGHARTLRDIGATKAATFYRGEVADKIDAFLKRLEG